LPKEQFKTIDDRRTRAQTAMKRTQSNVLKKGKQHPMNMSIDVTAKGKSSKSFSILNEQVAGRAHSEMK
jgi:hypothetical protein